MRKLLVINPHPDDEAFYFGGTISHYIKQNIDVHVLTLTNGEKGNITNENLKKMYNNTKKKEEFVSEVRNKEISNSLDILGIKKSNRYYAKLPNLGVDTNAIPIISEILYKVDPHVVISLNEAGTSRFTNQDHSWSAIATYYAILSKVKYLKKFQRYLTFSIQNIENYFDEYNELKVESELLTKVNILNEIDIKKNAASCHSSQKHLLDYFSKIRYLDIQTENYLERINICNTSSKGKDDIFYGIEDFKNEKAFLLNKYINFPIPLREINYKTSAIFDIHKTIEQRCTISAKFINTRNKIIYENVISSV